MGRTRPPSWHYVRVESLKSASERQREVGNKEERVGRWGVVVKSGEAEQQNTDDKRKLPVGV